MMDWRTHLRQDAEANQAFVAYFETLRKAAVLDMEDAPTWEAVLEARGKVKVLDSVLNSLTMADKEAIAYGRVFGNSRVTKSA